MDEARILYIIAIGFLVVLALSWFLLPFAVFGTKPKIDRLIQEAKATNEILCDIRDLLKPRT